MAQQQFKIGISDSHKLALIFGVLLVAPLFLVNAYNISQTRKETVEYATDHQTRFIANFGKDFVGSVENATGMLRIFLKNNGPQQATSSSVKNAAEQLLDVGQTLVKIDLYSYNSTTATATKITQFLSKNAQSRDQEFSLDNNSIVSELRSPRINEFTFKNVKLNSDRPVLAILARKLEQDSKSKDSLVAIGFMDLSRSIGILKAAMATNRIILATHDGRLLYSEPQVSRSPNEYLKQDKIFKDAVQSNEKSGTRETEDTLGTKVLASYYKPGFDLILISEVDFDTLLNSSQAYAKTLSVLALWSLGVLAIFCAIISSQFTTPLRKIAELTAQVGAGNFQIEFPKSRSNEVGSIAGALDSMSKKLSDFIQRAAARIKLEYEIEVSRALQQNVFPNQKIENSHLKIASHNITAAECGGDWWGYFQAGSKHVMIIADVTGHDLSSALITATGRGFLSALDKLANSSQINLDPAEILSIANKAVYDSAQGRMMMTAFVALFNFDDHTISFSSAAHNPPWIFRKQDDNSEFKQISLVARGPRLGERPELDKPFEVLKADFQKDDIIFLYTDGLLEMNHKSGHAFGKKQARQAVEKSIASTDPEAIVETLMVDFLTHNEGKKPRDDVTIAVARILS